MAAQPPPVTGKLERAVGWEFDSVGSWCAPRAAAGWQDGGCGAAHARAGAPQAAHAAPIGPLQSNKSAAPWQYAVGMTRAPSGHYVNEGWVPGMRAPNARAQPVDEVREQRKQLAQAKEGQQAALDAAKASRLDAVLAGIRAASEEGELAAEREHAHQRHKRQRGEEQRTALLIEELRHQRRASAHQKPEPSKVAVPCPHRGA